MGKKITQLATITEVADDDLIVGVDVSDTSGSDNGTNKKFTKATLLDGLAPLNPQLTGWNPDAETWVYHNVDDPTGYFKIEGKDVSANYSVGWRIMFTNGGNVIKGIITAITYSAPNTIITFLHEIDPTDSQALYLLTNSAITENYFSPHKAPLGFPMSPAKWSVIKTDTTVRAQSNPTAATWYNLGTFSCTVPIGIWSLMYKASPYCKKAGTFYDVFTTLSTGNNTESDVRYSANFATGVAGTTQVEIRGTVEQEHIVTVASKTVYYLNTKSLQSGGTNIGNRNDYTAARIRATCAYL